MSRAAALPRYLACLVAIQFATVPAAMSQEAAPASAITLELNAAQPSDKGCRLTFVVQNGLGADLTKAAYEIALFNEQGVVDRLTVLDFNELPNGKTKVTRFDLSGVDCAKISRILVNHATECVGASVDKTACLRKLTTSSKTSIAFGM